MFLSRLILDSFDASSAIFMCFDVFSSIFFRIDVVTSKCLVNSSRSVLCRKAFNGSLLNEKNLYLSEFSTLLGECWSEELTPDSSTYSFLCRIYFLMTNLEFYPELL